MVLSTGVDGSERHSPGGQGECPSLMLNSVRVNGGFFDSDEVGFSAPDEGVVPRSELQPTSTEVTPITTAPIANPWPIRNLGDFMP